MSWFSSNPKTKVEIHKEKPIEYNDIDNDESEELNEKLIFNDDYIDSDDDADFDEYED